LLTVTGFTTWRLAILALCFVNTEHNSVCLCVYVPGQRGFVAGFVSYAVRVILKETLSVLFSQMCLFTLQEDLDSEPSKLSTKLSGRSRTQKNIQGACEPPEDGRQTGPKHVV
jgi:hypothetical protein